MADEVQPTLLARYAPFVVEIIAIVVLTIAALAKL